LRGLRISYDAVSKRRAEAVPTIVVLHRGARLLSSSSLGGLPMSFRRSKLSRLSVVLLGAGLAVAIIVLVGSTLSSSVSSSVENARESVGWLLDATPEVLYVTGEPGLAVTVEYVAVLDWREHRWEDGPYSIESDGSLDMEVEVPADAFLQSVHIHPGRDRRRVAGPVSRVVTFRQRTCHGTAPA